ncbi:hypothetical protein NMY22_g9849 [Coprinellus aureogranulatus]|nr:hypothetical protein NMY22_g9849 [Coprinellus aureogranulatus]
MASKAAAVAVDFSRIYSSLGLGKETIAAVQAFRKRHADAQRVHNHFAGQPTTVDFAHYRSVLKNKAIVDEAEKLLKDFKPTTYDVSATLKAIETFEAKAVAKAKETEEKIDIELQELQATLSNIEDARPFDQLTTEDVAKAHPRIAEAVETMVKKGKWTVPGYKEKFGDLNLIAAHTRSFFYVGQHYEARGNGTVVVGQIYVEHLVPLSAWQPYPLVFIPGKGMAGTNFLNTPDGRPGWADFFLSNGYEVYIVDTPARGRSPWQRDLDGPQTSFDVRRIEERFTATRLHNLWPQSSLHTQWPGNGIAGDETFDNFYASIVPHLQSDVEAAEKLKYAGTKLLDRIGDVVLVTHSHSGQYGWILADARPKNVKAIVALEPLGPPFSEAVFPPFANARPFGLTDIPIEYDPPLSRAAELERVEVFSNPLLTCYRQMNPPRKLKNVAGVPVLIVTSESGYHAVYDYCTADYLRQAGVNVDHVRLEDVGIHGNGHMMFMEKNNMVIARDVIQPWLAQAAVLSTRSTDTTLSMRRNQEEIPDVDSSHSEL